jgi:hypothetical protein
LLSPTRLHMPPTDPQCSPLLLHSACLPPTPTPHVVTVAAIASSRAPATP